MNIKRSQLVTKGYLPKLIALFSVLFLTACAEKKDACTDFSLGDTSAPNVLIIGDSISMGYTPYAQLQLGSAADISHNLCNAKFSANGVANIDSWLKQKDQWALITLNHGLWDAAHGVSINEYSNNLRIEALKAQATGAKVIFFTSTPIPENVPGYLSYDIDAYNQAAKLVMASLGIPVFDLNQKAASIPELLINPDLRNDVHYTGAGYHELGIFVANAISISL